MKHLIYYTHGSDVFRKPLEYKINTFYVWQVGKFFMVYGMYCIITSVVVNIIMIVHNIIIIISESDSLLYKINYI